MKVFTWPGLGLGLGLGFGLGFGLGLGLGLGSGYGLSASGSKQRLWAHRMLGDVEQAEAEAHLTDRQADTVDPGGNTRASRRR